MALNAIYKKAVKKIIPSAIPVDLEKIDEYSPGKILIYSKKPKKLIPMRKHDLDFTGVSLQNVLAEGQELTLTTAKSFLFDTGKDKASSSVTVDVSADLELSATLSELSAGGKLNFKLDRDKSVTVNTDFGRITHISTNLVNSMSEGSVMVKVDHPLVAKAIENGGVMFIITTIYQGAHSNVSVSLSKNISETTGESASVTKVKEEASESVADKHTTCTVISRDIPTPLAYLLLKVSVNSKGVVNFNYDNRSHLRKFKVGLSSMRPHSKRSHGGGGEVGPNPNPPSEARVLPRNISEISVSELDDWVVVKTEKVKISGDSAIEADTVPSGKTDSPSSKLPAEPVEEVAVQNVDMHDLESAPPPSPPPSSSSQQVSHPFPTSHSEIPSATVEKVEKLGAAPPPSAQVGQDEMDGDIDEHFLYSLKDFQPFESTTYRGIYEETKKWLVPFQANLKLKEAFFTYTKPPRAYEKLNKLSSYFLEIGDALRAENPLPPNKLKGIDSIVAALSEGTDKKLDEVSAVIVVAEAADEFPQHIIQKIIALPAEKRKLLTDLILNTPYGSSNHAYADAGPFNDPDLKPIMGRMGFSLSSTQKLLHTYRDSEAEEDMLAAAFILMLASE